MRAASSWIVSDNPCFLRQFPVYKSTGKCLIAGFIQLTLTHFQSAETHKDVGRQFDRNSPETAIEF